MSVQLVRGNALDLPLADASVDLVVTSPPYFGLRSYQDDGSHYSGQIGSEPSPAEFVDALIAATGEMVRVLKPSGSIWVNLGDKYAATGGGGLGSSDGVTGRGPRPARRLSGIPAKSLIGVPWRYAVRCIDGLGLILRAEVIWSKPNGLPESVTDRVRRSHETWFHFVREPRYFSSVDEIRSAHVRDWSKETPGGHKHRLAQLGVNAESNLPDSKPHPLGALPGSVWTIPTQPLTVPASLGVDHFAAFPMEWPRRLIGGWCPREVCSGCGEGRHPVSDAVRIAGNGDKHRGGSRADKWMGKGDGVVPPGPWGAGGATNRTLTGYACACPDTSAPSTPGVVLDSFGGTGTTALVADSLGRHGISVDMSADYCRLAAWRTTDAGQRASALQVDKTAAVDAAGFSLAGQIDLFGEAS